MESLNNELITPWEVVRYGPASDKYATKHVVDHIGRKERKLFRECLGWDLYEAMLDDRKNWNTLDEYDDTVTYGLNAYVIFNGSVIKSTKTSNNDRPGTSDGGWESAEKFTNPVFNEFWVKHLRKYLAYEITYTSVRYSTHQLGDKGLTEIVGDTTDIRTVSSKSIGDYKKELKDDVLDELEDLIEWVKTKVKLGGNYEIFKTALFIDDKCEDGQCSPKASRSRRVLFDD